jgi:hypothetical protein
MTLIAADVLRATDISLSHASGSGTAMTCRITLRSKVRELEDDGNCGIQLRSNIGSSQTADSALMMCFDPNVASMRPYLVATRGLGLSGLMTTVGVVLGVHRGVFGWPGMNSMRDDSFTTRDTLG